MVIASVVFSSCLLPSFFVASIFFFITLLVLSLLLSSVPTSQRQRPTRWGPVELNHLHEACTTQWGPLFVFFSCLFLFLSFGLSGFLSLCFFAISVLIVFLLSSNFCYNIPILSYAVVNPTVLCNNRPQNLVLP